MKQVFKFVKDTTSLLSFIKSLSKSAIYVSFAFSMLKGFMPYIYIVGGAAIIDALLSVSYDQAIVITIVMIVCAFVLQCILYLLMRQREISSMAINRMCNGEVILKSVSLDYATFEDKKNLEEFKAADFNTSRQGGFGYFLLMVEKMVEGIVSLLISFFLIFQLCLQEAINPSIFPFIVGREGSFLCVAIIVIVLCMVYAKLIKFINKNNLILYNESIEIDQKYEYFSDQMFMDEHIAKDIRLYHMKDFVFHKWKQLSLKSNLFEQRRWGFMMKLMVGNTIINDIVIFFAYLFVLLKTITKAISIGSFVQYVGVFTQFNMALRTTIEAIGELQIRHSYLMFYINYMKKKNVLDTGHKKINVDEDIELEFHNVSFKYPNLDTYVLKDVSCKLNLHHKFAIVGRNGAGKTTFIKLLCRLYEVSEGTITLNGIDIKEYDYKDYLKLFAVVFQDFHLFSMPIRENVAGSYDIKDEDVWKALTFAGVSDKVRGMENGLHTMLYHDMGEGVDVSGGQAQKIAIARALYKDSPFVILDEPTAALDPISEYEIYEKFNEMVKNKTSIYISHRMSSCKFCDDILVFDKGQLVQRGNHEQLMKDPYQIYYKLWNAQAKYYSEG